LAFKKRKVNFNEHAGISRRVAAADRAGTIYNLLRGFESEEAANLLGDILRSIFLVISSFIDLERLDGVTVAYNYAVALAGRLPPAKSPPDPAIS
jgi:hypothetical protein